MFEVNIFTIKIWLIKTKTNWTAVFNRPTTTSNYQTHLDWLFWKCFLNYFSLGFEEGEEQGENFEQGLLDFEHVLCRRYKQCVQNHLPPSQNFCRYSDVSLHIICIQVFKDVMKWLDLLCAISNMNSLYNYLIEIY